MCLFVYLLSQNVKYLCTKSCLSVGPLWRHFLWPCCCPHSLHWDVSVSWVLMYRLGSGFSAEMGKHRINSLHEPLELFLPSFLPSFLPLWRGRALVWSCFTDTVLSGCNPLDGDHVQHLWLWAPVLIEFHIQGIIVGYCWNTLYLE